MGGLKAEQRGTQNLVTSHAQLYHGTLRCAVVWQWVLGSEGMVLAWFGKMGGA